jgi:hypothetical protein
MMKGLKVFVFLALVFGFVVSGYASSVIWYPTGPGGGGFCWGAAFDPDDKDTFIIGSDMCGVYLTTDGGATFKPWNEGLVDDRNASNHYVRQCVGVDNDDDFDGFVIATAGGVWIREH